MIFLLEIGTEELPTSFVDRAINQWKQIIPTSLKKNFLSSESIFVYGTPRRLAVIITGLLDKQTDRNELIKGPSVKAAFTEGKPTIALEGFLRKQNVEIEALEIRSTKKGECVFVDKKIQGIKTTEILPELINAWIGGLEGKRFMKWGNGDFKFSRPIRWIVSLCDSQILPIKIENGDSVITSSSFSYGHRVLRPGPINIPHAASYVDILKSAYVEVDPARRYNIIENDIKTIAENAKGVIDTSHELLKEVVNLVEYPTAILGTFNEEFLELPDEVIKTVMIKHQRYFPIKKISSNQLLSQFISISNGDPSKSTIITQGNEKVLKARLSDAQFFYASDSNQSLSSYLPKLENVTFQKELGSIRNKVDRIINISKQVSNQLQFTPQQIEEVLRTALLCKADLVTQMVYEFPELQGIMGQKYALVSGELEIVAQGIFDHYLTRGHDDKMPKSLTGIVVGIADRLDTLIGIFGLGMIPTGSSDPFGLRRAANAIISIAWGSQLSINLSGLISEGCQSVLLNNPEQKSPLKSLRNFFAQRIQSLLQDEMGIDYDLVNAVLGDVESEYIERAFQDITDLKKRAQFLQNIRNNGILEKVYQTINRSTRLAKQGNLGYEEFSPSVIIDNNLFKKLSEQQLYDSLINLEPTINFVVTNKDYDLLMKGLINIIPLVDEFFDGKNSVLVMDENQKVKQNRLNLLGILRNYGRILADFGEIVKS